MIDFITCHPVIFMLIVFGAILVVYLIGSITVGKAVLISEKLVRGVKTKADMIYYLPTASLQIAATAQVVVATDVNQKIIAATLTDLSFDNTVSFVADTDYAFTLNYNPSSFMADEVKFTVGPSGLLDSINTTTEDRLSNLISEIGTLPSVLNPRLASIEEPLTDALVINNTQTVVHTKNFYLPLSEIEEPKIFSWIINADGSVTSAVSTDASFAIEFTPSLNEKYPVPDQTAYDGVLTRPLQTFVMTVSSANPGITPALKSTYNLTIPDRNSIITVPIERSSFVKRVNAPKFSSGLLLENYINKPSQFEGFASIPVNIGKAIVSIPARLFTFTINKNDPANGKPVVNQPDKKNNEPNIHL